MQRNPHRSGRSALVTRALVDSGWSQDPYTARVIPEWKHRYPDLPIVADGRPCKAHRDAGVTSPDDPRALNCDDCYVDRGRGTTLIDLVRRDTSGGLNRADFLSIKTGKIGADGKLPSRIDLGTGNVETIRAIETAALGGSSIPVLFFASEDTEDGEPSEDGYAVFVNVAPFIREHGCVPISTEGYGRGQAPPCYVALSSRRITGVPGGNKAASKAVQAHETMGLPLPPGKWYKRAHNFKPGFDDKGRFWSKPYAVHYSELRFSLSACGIKREHWKRVNLSDIARFVDSHDWDEMALSGEDGILRDVISADWYA